MAECLALIDVNICEYLKLIRVEFPTFNAPLFAVFSRIRFDISRMVDWAWEGNDAETCSYIIVVLLPSPWSVATKFFQIQIDLSVYLTFFVCPSVYVPTCLPFCYLSTYSHSAYCLSAVCMYVCKFTFVSLVITHYQLSV